MAKAGCSCPETQEFDGKLYPVTLDPDCPQHSFPRDEWRLDSPLMRHRRYVDEETGERLTAQEAHEVVREPGEEGAVDSVLFHRRFRWETPRETTLRLIDELAVQRQTG